MTISILAALIISFFTLPAPGSIVCFCAVPEVPEAFDQARAIFIGEVIEIVEPTTYDEKASLPGRLYVIRFKVEKSWKGVSANEMEVLSAQGRFGCLAYPSVRKGEKYLIYADPAYQNGLQVKGFVMITACNRTALMPEPRRRFSLGFNQSEINRRDGSGDLEKLDEIARISRSPRITLLHRTTR